MSIMRVPPNWVCKRTIFDSSSVRRSALFGMALLSEPVVNVQILDALKMPLVVSHQTMSFDDGGRGYQDVGIADQLTSLVEAGIDLCCLHNDGV